MAYACPVCEALVPDGEHLAHHLAVVAMTRGGDHRAWLDETVPDWADDSPAELAEEAVEHAESVEHDLVDDPRATGEGRADATPGRPDVDAGTFGSDLDAGGPERTADAAADARAHAPLEGGTDVGDVDGEAATILEEARALTRERREDGASVDDGGHDDGGGGGDVSEGSDEAESDETGGGVGGSETDSDE